MVFLHPKGQRFDSHVCPVCTFVLFAYSPLASRVSSNYSVLLPQSKGCRMNEISKLSVGCVNVCNWGVGTWSRVACLVVPGFQKAEETIDLWILNCWLKLSLAFSSFSLISVQGWFRDVWSFRKMRTDSVWQWVETTLCLCSSSKRVSGFYLSGWRLLWLGSRSADELLCCEHYQLEEISVSLVQGSCPP